MGDVSRLIPAKPVTHDAPLARSPRQENFTPNSPRRRERHTKAANTIRLHRVRTLCRRRVLWDFPKA